MFKQELGQKFLEKNMGNPVMAFVCLFCFLGTCPFIFSATYIGIFSYLLATANEYEAFYAELSDFGDAREETPLQQWAHIQSYDLCAGATQSDACLNQIEIYKQELANWKEALEVGPEPIPDF